MSKYSPQEIDLDKSDYNPHQYSFAIAKQDGIYMGRMLMRDEIKRLIKATVPVPTKAVQRVLDLIDTITLEAPANDSVR